MKRKLSFQMILFLVVGGGSSDEGSDFVHGVAHNNVVHAPHGPDLDGRVTRQGRYT